MKKFISLSLAAAMALSLAACGAAESEAPAESAAESGSTAATAEGAAAPIKLGGIGPTTGANALYGTAVRRRTGRAGDQRSRGLHRVRAQV